MDKQQTPRPQIVKDGSDDSDVREPVPATDAREGISEASDASVASGQADATVAPGTSGAGQGAAGPDTADHDEAGRDTAGQRRADQPDASQVSQVSRASQVAKVPEMPKTRAQIEEERARKRRARRHGRHFLSPKAKDAQAGSFGPDSSVSDGGGASDDQSRSPSDSGPRTVKRLFRQSHRQRRERRSAVVCRRIVAPILILGAIVCAVFALLNQGPWKPSPLATASATVSTRYAATDPGVLPLVDSRTRISASASRPFCLAVATAQDSGGWLADKSYTRVTGLSDWSHLQTRPAPASGTQTQGTTGAKSVAFRDSDLWRTVRCGRNVEMTWSGSHSSNQVLVLETRGGAKVGTESGTKQRASAPNAVTLSLTWHRSDTDNTPRILWVCSILLLLLGVLFATVFSLSPRLRRKPKRLVEAERDLASSEGIESRTVAGEDAPRWANDHIVSRRRRVGRRRHAASGHGFRGLRSRLTRHSRPRSASAGADAGAGTLPERGTSSPAVRDVSGKNLVAQMQNSSSSTDTLTDLSASEILGGGAASGSSSSAGSSAGHDAVPSTAESASEMAAKPIEAGSYRHPQDADVREYLRRLSEEELGTGGLERDQGLDADTHFFAPIKDDPKDDPRMDGGQSGRSGAASGGAEGKKDTVDEKGSKGKDGTDDDE